jgi:hypothetical protein
MARNANSVAQAGSSNRVEQPVLDGSYPARIVQIIFLGIQDQRAFQGQAKPPVDQVRVTYELSHEFMEDEDGNVLADKPRWYSEQFAFHNADVDLATSTKRFKAYCPQVANPADHEWGDNLLGLPVQVQLKARKVTQGKHAGKTFVDIKGVSPQAKMPGYTQPELVNPTMLFDPQAAIVSIDDFNSFPDWLCEVILGAHDYVGSTLGEALGGNTEARTEPPVAPVKPPKPTPKLAAEHADDEPY